MFFINIIIRGLWRLTRHQHVWDRDVWLFDFPTHNTREHTSPLVVGPTTRPIGLTHLCQHSRALYHVWCDVIWWVASHRHEFIINLITSCSCSKWIKSISGFCDYYYYYFFFIIRPVNRWGFVFEHAIMHKIGWILPPRGLWLWLWTRKAWFSGFLAGWKQLLLIKGVCSFARAILHCNNSDKKELTLTNLIMVLGLPGNSDQDVDFTRTRQTIAKLSSFNPRESWGVVGYGLGIRLIIYFAQ